MSKVLRVPVAVMDENKLTAWLLPRLRELKEALNGGELPQKVGEEGRWQCNGYCPFTSYCWPEGIPKR